MGQFQITLRGGNPAASCVPPSFSSTIDAVVVRVDPPLTAPGMMISSSPPSMGESKEGGIYSSSDIVDVEKYIDGSNDSVVGGDAQFCGVMDTWMVGNEG